MITTPEGYKKQRERKRSVAVENRIWDKAHGICTKCHKEPAIKNQSLCWRCRANERDRKAIIYYENKDKGLCPICGVRKPMKGYVQCAECKEYSKNYHNNLYRERKAKGECVSCGKKLPQGHTFVRCGICHAKDLARQRKKAA